MELLNELQTRNSLDLTGCYFTGYYFVCKASCSNCSLRGDYINLLLPRECLFKIEITVYHHSPGFLLMPLKLSMMLGDKLHLGNLLWFSEYLLLSCSLPEVGKNGCGERGEHWVTQTCRRLLQHQLCWGWLAKCPLHFR